MPAKNSLNKYIIWDFIFLFTGMVFCALVWIEFFSEGYDGGLTYYNVFIARTWAIMSVFSALYAVFSFKNTSKIRPTAVILLCYSLLTIILVLIVIIVGL